MLKKLNKTEEETKYLQTSFFQIEKYRKLEVNEVFLLGVEETFFKIQNSYNKVCERRKPGIRTRTNQKL